MATTTAAQYLFSAYLTSNLAAAASTYATITTLTETLDANGDFNNTTGVYTAPFTGWFTFRLWATNDPTGSTSPNQRFIRLMKGTTPVYLQTTSGANGGNNMNLQSNDVTLFLETGEQLTMQVMNQAAGAFIGGQVDPALGTGWALTNTSDALAGLPIDIGANAPKIQQIDLLKDILKKYNLVMVPDRNIPKLLHFEPFGDYIGGGNTLDWTSKLDYSKDQVISPTTDYQGRVLTFTYSKGNDAASELFNKEGKRVYGDYQIDGYTIDPNDHPNDFAQGNKAVTLLAQSTPCNTINGTSNVVPKFVDASGEFVNPGLRYLYFIPSALYIALYDEGITDGVLTSVGAANHYSEINANLNDGNPANDWQIPYLEAMKQEKIATQNLDPLTGKPIVTNQVVELTPSVALSMWELTGVANDAIAKARVDSIKEQQSAVSDSIKSMESLSSDLNSTISEMAIGSDKLTIARRRAAEFEIDTALANARAGRGLPLAGQLTSSLGIVKQNDPALYRNAAEMAFATAVTQNKLAELAKITGESITDSQRQLDILSAQLTNAESYSGASLGKYDEMINTANDQYALDVAALDATVKTAQEQYDALTGIDSSVLSLGDALARYADIIAGAGFTNAKEQTERLDAQLLKAENQLNALLGIDNSVLSLKDSVDKFIASLTDLNADLNKDNVAALEAIAGQIQGLRDEQRVQSLKQVAAMETTARNTTSIAYDTVPA